MNKVIIGSLVVMVLAIGGIFMLLRGGGSNAPASSTGQTNVSVIDGKQVVEIKAKGGYAPRVTAAKANMPTVINVQTNGTFDCSSALTVPAIGFRTMLPSSGVTPIEIPPQQPGTTIKGVCSMGMYSFAVNFN
jgi:plastocyanin domain-containing protein